MLSTPLITVIMPCFNAEAYLNTAIECVFGQSYPSIELIIVDDGSMDQSFEIIEKACKCHPGLIAIRQTNQGPYPARNLGLAHAKGDFIAFLDADDYWSSDCLEKLYDALVSQTADLSYCGWQNIVENGQNGLPYVPPSYEKEDIVLSFLTGCPWPIHAALIRKNLVDKIQGFSTRCFSAMDYDFWLRISAVSQKMTIVPEVLAFYRWHHHGQISSVKWKQVLNAWQVKKDFVTNNPTLAKNISHEKQSELIDGFLVTQAYTAFWKRDLVSAQQLFRVIFHSSIWRIKDLPYIASSLLPYSLFSGLVNFFDKTGFK